MSNPGDTPRSDLPPLEPWALELEASEPGGGDPRAREELARVVSVLRSLPEPETPPRLGESILTRVTEDAARPRVLRGVFGGPARAATLALAAGVAGLLVMGGLPQTFAPGQDSNPSGSLVIEVPAHALPQGQGFAAAGALPRTGAQFVSLGAARHPAARLSNPFAGASVWQRQMDRHLNQLQLDPHAFAQQLEQAAGRDGYIAQLARRAGERGDAPEIAMHVRRSTHPMADQIVQRMLRASLVERASRR